MSNYSTYPVTNDFGFTYWSLMVPPKKPLNVLILGYGDGTIADLIRLVWGQDIKITGVDIVMPNRTTADHLVLTDARDYAGRQNLDSAFDYIVVDIFVDNVVPAWVGSKTFMRNLTHLLAPSGLIAFNSFSAAPIITEISQHFDIALVKELRGNQVVFGSLV